MFLIIILLIGGLWRRTKRLEFLIYNRKKFLFLYFYNKSKLEKLRGHKVLPLMSYKFTPPSVNLIRSLFSKNNPIIKFFDLAKSAN